MNDLKLGKEHAVSRRDAIKALSAAAGATLIASLPVDWETPVIEMGVLPAYAQTSPEELVASFNASTTNPSAGSMDTNVYTWGNWAGGALSHISIFPVSGMINWSNGSLVLTNSTSTYGSFSQTFTYANNPVGMNMGLYIYGVDGAYINTTDTIE